MGLCNFVDIVAKGRNKSYLSRRLENKDDNLRHKREKSTVELHVTDVLTDPVISRVVYASIFKAYFSNVCCSTDYGCSASVIMLYGIKCHQVSSDGLTRKSYSNNFITKSLHN